jgi:hypothetical protein
MASPVGVVDNLTRHRVADCPCDHCAAIRAKQFNPHDAVKDAKRSDEMTFADFQRGARKVIESDHKGMPLT